jgi:hypothetical protein
MNRLLPTLTLILALLPIAAAQAEITLNFMERGTSCELIPTGGGNLIWSDRNFLPGPYFMDLDVLEDGHHLRSVHDSAITLNGDNLTVTGTYLGTLAAGDQATIFQLLASANLMVGFTPMQGSTVNIEVTIPDGAEAWFFDLTENDFGFDNQGPGVFTLEDVLMPGHEYLFQVFYNVGVNHEGPAEAEASATMSLVVVPDPVPAGEVAWGSVKALFR